jgi:anti-sigma regulatory factor (Ser/Thr protein kinase)
MKQDNNRFEIVFICDLEAISDMANLCIAHIESSLADKEIGLGLITRIKWVIMEMLTNAIKHSGMEECRLALTINDQQVILEKKDSGNPLALSESTDRGKLQWPLKTGSFPARFPVYHNGTDSLSVLAHDANRATFFVEEIAEEAMPGLLLNTSEHFGLLILTKASDTFEYEYEPGSGINHFKSTFNLLEN